MKKILLLLLTALIGLTSSSQAEPTPFVPASGLHLHLSTGGYKFFVGATTTTPAATRALRKEAGKVGGVLPTEDGFAASVVLANFSRSKIDFSFSDAGAAVVKFRFTVTDDAGQVVWQSDTGTVSAQVITPATLQKGSRWKRVIQIPLKVDGAWLKPGLYTLEAKLAADPSFSAKLAFAVAPAADVTGDTGISGQVFVQPAPTPTTRFAPQPIKAAIRIREIRLPNARYDHPEFSYDGQTDENGSFKVVTPAGRYLVTATQIGLLPVRQTFAAGAVLVQPSPTKTVEVGVEKGAFTATTITLEAAPPTGQPAGL